MTNCFSSGGFSFCGVNISSLSLEYVPENKDTYVYRPAKYTPHEENFEGHDGGYFFGTTVKPKDFVLRCIFQQTHLNSGLLTRIFNTFRRGRTGKLVFDRRPWMWYDATVIDVDDSQMTNFLNGVIKITMRAYYPFARTDKTTIGDEDPYEDDLLANTAMMKGAAWNLDKDYADDPNFDKTLSDTQTIDVFNPGTERADMAIYIEGDVGAHGIRLINTTTGQTCDIVGLNTTDQDRPEYGKTLVVDGLSGKCLLTESGQAPQYGFLYHDNGFLDLASNYPILRSVPLVGESGTQTLRVSTASDDEPSPVTADFLDYRIRLTAAGTSSLLGIAILNNLIIGDAGQTTEVITKIIDVSEDGKTLTVNTTLPSDVLTTADIYNMNTITVSKIHPSDTVNITRLEFKYMPTFS